MSGFDDFPVAAAPAAAPPPAAAGGGSFDAFPRADAAPAADTGDQVSRGVANGRLKPPAKSFLEGFADAWKGETPSSLFQQNMLVRVANTAQEKGDIERRLTADYDKGKADGSITEPYAPWIARRIDEEYKASRPQQPAPDQSLGDTAKAAWNAMLANPGRFAGELAKGLLVDPELLVQPELGAARAITGVGKAAEAARVAARTAEVGVEGAAQGAAISAVRQEQETGQVSGQQVANEAAASGVGMATLHAGSAVAGKLVANVARAGLEAAAKRTGATVNPEVEAQFRARMEQDMQTMSPTDALEKNLRDAGLEPREAKAMADAAKTATEPPAVAPKPADSATAGLDGERAGDSGDPALAADAAKREAQEPIKPRDVAKIAAHEEPLVKPDEPVAADAGKATPSGEPDPAGAQPDNTPPAGAAQSPIASAVVRFGGKEYDGATHIEAIQKAIADGVPTRTTESGVKVPVRDAAKGDSINLFRTRDGDVITRDQAGDLVGAKRTEDMPPLTSGGVSPDVRGQLHDVARNLGIAVNEVNGSYRARDGVVEIPKADAEVPTASGGPNDVFAHELGHAIMQKRVASFRGFPKSELRSQVSNWDELVAASRAFRPGLHEHVDPKFRRHALKPDEVIADSIASVLTGRQPIALLQPLMDKLGWTRLDLGLEPIARDTAVKTPNVPPERSLKITLGQKGQRNVDFPDARDKDTFRLATALTKQFRGGADSTNARATIDALLARVKQHLNIQDSAEAMGAAQLYRDTVIMNARLLPEGSRFTAPTAKGGTPNAQAGRVSPELLASLGLAGIAGVGAYALTGDKSKAIAALALGAALPYAAAIVGKLGRSAVAIVQHAWTDGRFPTKQMFRDYYGAVSVGAYAIDTWQKGVEAMLKGEPDVKASWLKIRDASQGHAVSLSPREAAAAGELRRFLDMMGDRGQRADVLHDLLENYLPGLYQKKPFASWRDLVQSLYQNDAFQANHTGMSPASRHALQKIIPDYRTVDALIAQGKLDLVPLTDNPFEMAAVYAKSLNKTMANKKLIETLKQTTVPGVAAGTAKLLMPITTRDAAQRIAVGNRILQRQWDLPDSAVEFANRFDIMHAPKDYVIVKHPALEGMRVHRDVAGPLKLVLDTSDPTAIGKGLFAVSMAAKSALFSYSLFHAGSLATIGLTQAARRPSFVASLWRNNKMRLDNNFHPEVADALQHGLLPFHQVNDIDPSFFQRAINLAEKYAGSMPGALGWLGMKTIEIPRVAHQAINHFTWDVLHPTLKLASYMTEVKSWIEKHPTATADELATAKRQISQGTNDLYGGINWFELANNVPNAQARTLATALYSPQGKRWQQILMLAPDWLHASLRAWTEGMKAAAPGIPAKASDSMYRSYLLMSGLMYLGVADYLQQKYTGEHIWDKEDWSVVDMGDGRRIQLNKHFMEGVHLIWDPQKFIINKLNYLPKETMQQLFDKEYLTHGKDGFGGPPMVDKSIAGRGVHAVKNLLSPISIQNMLADPASAVAGFFGMPIYGRTYEVQQAQKAADRERRRVAKEQTKGKGKTQ